MTTPALVEPDELPAPPDWSTYAQIVKFAEAKPSLDSRFSVPDIMLIGRPRETPAEVPIVGGWSISSDRLGAALVTVVVDARTVTVTPTATGRGPVVKVAGWPILVPPSAIPDVPGRARTVELKFYALSAAVTPAAAGPLAARG